MGFLSRGNDEELIRLRAELAEMKKIMSTAKSTNSYFMEMQMKLAGKIAVLEMREKGNNV